MNRLASVVTLAVASAAGTAAADIGFSVGIGSSFGFCGSRIGLSTGISIGSHWGWYAPASRPYTGWNDCGQYWGGYSGWYRPSRYGHDHGWGHYDHRRRHRGHHGHAGHHHRWSDAGFETGPAAVTVASTHDRPVNRTPAVTDTVAADDRLAQAWDLLEKGEANRAQGFFALAAAKAPDDAVAKLGFALASAEMGDTARAEWSVGRALGVDDGELAGLELGQKASIALADLLDAWQASGTDLSARLEAAMPGVVTQPSVRAAGS